MKKATRTRLQRHKKEISGIRLQRRDFRILQILYDYKFADSHLIFELLGNHCRSPEERGTHHKEVILKRLRKLFDHGFVQRPAHQPLQAYKAIPGSEGVYAGSDPILYSLGDKGLLTLGDFLGKDYSSFISLFKNDRYRSLQFLKHTMMRNRFRASIELAVEKRPDSDLVVWKETQAELSDSVSLEIENGDGVREEKAFPLIPDDFFTLQIAGKKRHFIVEAERSAKHNPRTKQKMRLYYEYCIRHRRRAEKTHEIAPSEGLQVLYLAPSWERRNNLRDIAIKADPRGKGSSLFLFASETDFDYRQVPERVFDPIWLPGKAVDLFDRHGEAYEWMSLLGSTG